MKKSFSTIVAVALMLLTSCGGGGGGGGSKGFIGTWSTFLSWSGSTCGLTPEYIGLDRINTPFYRINQDGENIAVENIDTKFSLTGSTVDSGKGFIATSAAQDAGCRGGIMNAGVTFTNLSGDDADAEFGIYVSCPGYNPPTCVNTWTGTAHRE